MTSDKKQNDFLSLALKLTVIGALVVLLLAAVNALTADTIAGREAEKGREARQALIVDAETFEEVKLPLTEEEAKTVTAVYIAKAEDRILGYCFDVSVYGFGNDPISMIVAVSSEGNLYGIKIISNSETPGIGAAALSEDGGLIGQYAGIPMLSVDGVSGVSGATITSKGVSSGVKTVVDLLDRLTKEGVIE